MVIPHDDLTAVPGDDARMYRLPSEIIEAGVTHLTAVIHMHSAYNPLWLTHMPKDPREVDWPEESGGRLALEEILSRSERILRGPPGLKTLNINLPVTGGFGTVDAILYKLLSPERTRQYGEMMKAMDRVCKLIAANRS